MLGTTHMSMRMMACRSWLTGQGEEGKDKGQDGEGP